MLDVFLTAASFGLTAFAIPGHFQAYLLNITLRFGWRHGIWVIAAPLFTDPPIIVLMTFVLGNLPFLAIQAIRVFGGCFLLWIAWNTFKQWRAEAATNAADAPLAPSMTTRQVLTTAMTMNALSPGPYLFWGIINGPLLLKALGQSVWHGAAMLVGFYSFFLGGMLLLLVVFHRLGGMPPRVMRRVLLFAIGLLVFFGGRFILEGLFGTA